MATSVAQTTEGIVGKCVAVARDVLQLPARHVWIDYDKEADVLHMSFRKSQGATKTVEVNEDILVRKGGRTVVGVTIMNASAHR
ncbi:DUF2283 domain-containing protein [Candidatus Sumerlaeota bacterium]|nr:DUF2283 domain-containing protein [Candidatus Sumerlaeota bacterium]